MIITYKKGFRRLTAVFSIVIGILMSASYYKNNIDKAYSRYELLVFFISGVLSVWIIYFLISYVIKGFNIKVKDKQDHKIIYNTTTSFIGSLSLWLVGILGGLFGFLAPHRSDLSETFRFRLAFRRDDNPINLNDALCGKNSAVVTVDETGVTCHRPDGKSENLKWTNLRSVIIETNNLRFDAAVFKWILSGESSICVVPGGAAGEREMLEALGKLPNFKKINALEAMNEWEQRKKSLTVRFTNSAEQHFSDYEKKIVCWEVSPTIKSYGQQ